MEKLVINNLSTDELLDLYAVLHHIVACYVNLSHPCKGADCRKVEGVHISPAEFESLSKITYNIGKHFQISNGNEKS